MRAVRVLIIVFILLQLLTNGRAMPVMAATYNSVAPQIAGVWNKQRIIDNEDIDNFAKKTKTAITDYVIPRCKSLCRGLKSVCRGLIYLCPERVSSPK